MNIIGFLEAQYNQQSDDIEQSYALNAEDDMHWRLPGWLDKDYMRRDLELKRRILELHKHCNASCYVVQVLVDPFTGHQDFDPTWNAHRT